MREGGCHRRTWPRLIGQLQPGSLCRWFGGLVTMCHGVDCLCVNRQTSLMSFMRQELMAFACQTGLLRGLLVRRTEEGMFCKRIPGWSSQLREVGQVCSLASFLICKAGCASMCKAGCVNMLNLTDVSKSPFPEVAWSWGVQIAHACETFRKPSDTLWLPCKPWTSGAFLNLYMHLCSCFQWLDSRDETLLCLKTRGGESLLLNGPRRRRSNGRLLWKLHSALQDHLWAQHTCRMLCSALLCNIRLLHCDKQA